MGPAAGALHLALALDLPALSAAQRRLGAFLAAGGCPPEVCFRVELVVEEAMMNVIRHAEPMGATHAALDASCADGRALVAMEDNGPAFDPLQATQRPIAGAIAGTHDGGFGLHLDGLDPEFGLEPNGLLLARVLGSLHLPLQAQALHLVGMVLLLVEPGTDLAKQHAKDAAAQK